MFPSPPPTLPAPKGSTWRQALRQGHFFEGYRWALAKCILSNFLALYAYESVRKACQPGGGVSIAIADATAAFQCNVQQPLQVQFASITRTITAPKVAAPTAAVSISHPSI